MKITLTKKRVKNNLVAFTRGENINCMFFSKNSYQTHFHFFFFFCFYGKKIGKNKKYSLKCWRSWTELAQHWLFVGFSIFFSLYKHSAVDYFFGSFSPLNLQLLMGLWHIESCICVMFRHSPCLLIMTLPSISGIIVWLWEFLNLGCFNLDGCF